MSRLSVAAGVLFFLCVGFGYRLSSAKPLWNDEIYTQINSIDQASYKDIALGRIREGNNCPLFYLIQKGICDLTQYQFPLRWDKEWNLSDHKSQIIMRINSNIFMSASIALIFYFFSRNYSIWAGVYSLLLSFSSFMVWAYWAEARPYALWVFLTTLQSVLFLGFIKQESDGQSHWRRLVIVSLLLSITVVFGAVQAAVMLFLLAIFKKEKWLKCVILAGLAAGIALFYYLRSQGMKFWVEKDFFELITASFSFDQMLILAVYAGFLGVRYFQKEGGVSMRLNPYFIFTLLMLMMAFLMLVILHIISAGEQAGFSVSDRYFIFLVPIGIIAATLFSGELLRVAKGRRWLFANLLIGLSGLLVIRFLKLIVKLIG